MLKNKGTLLGATMLVAGTCIGGGMLALPVATGEAGFFPSLATMLIGWAFMTLSALFLSEVNMWMKEGAHVVTMAARFLGPIGKGAAWLLYLFIGYASLTAYTAGGGQLLGVGIKSLFHFPLSEPLAIILFVAIFGLVLYLGNIILGRINTILMIGLVLSYLLLIGSGGVYAQWNNLLRNVWGNSLTAVPLLLTIFSFQTIVPSLTIYLNRDVRALRLAIILGTTVALMVYTVWEWLVLGTVLVDGDYGLAAALAQGKLVTEFLAIAVNNPWVGAFADFFAFFALVTSFLGIALGLFDFLADGLKIARDRWGNITLGLLVAAPTLFFALALERVFLLALDSSGGIGDSILNILFPALMLWVGRYRMNLHSDYRIPGGRPIILLTMAYALFVLTIELLGRFGLIISLGG